jgi:hypothetical protein
MTSPLGVVHNDVAIKPGRTGGEEEGAGEGRGGGGQEEEGVTGMSEDQKAHLAGRPYKIDEKMIIIA